MKRRTVIAPLLLPRLSDQAAVALLEILYQLVGTVEHHYGPQIQRWRQRQRRCEPQPAPPQAPFDLPF